MREMEVIERREVQQQQRWEQQQQRQESGYHPRHNFVRDVPVRNPIYQQPYDPPRPKMPTFDGKEEWNSFFTPFERLALRNNWNDMQKLDRLHESLRGVAASFITLQPVHIIENFTRLCEELKHRFGRTDPPATAGSLVISGKQRRPPKSMWSKSAAW